MIVALLAIISAVLLSAISLVFSVSGWMTLFSGAPIAVGIMGGALELAKISATVWLYHFWKMTKAKVRILGIGISPMKIYFFAAITILIVISSIGIFGFLTRSYVGQEADTQNIGNQIERVQQRITRQENEIETANEQLDLLNQAIEQYLELDVITRGLEQRQEQQQEREQLRQRIQEAENQIAEYENELLELRQQQNEHQVSVGPIRYIASALYGEENAQAYYDNAVRILIILFVIVFDPFAVLLMVAGNVALQKRGKKADGRGRPKGSITKKKEPTNQKPKQEPTTKKKEQVSSSQSESEQSQETQPQQRNISYEPAGDVEPENQGDGSPPPKLHRRKKRKKRN